MQFRIIFLALFFVTISHVLCIGPNDIPTMKAIAIPFKETPDGPRVLLVTISNKKNKGAMFVRGHVKEDEIKDPGFSATRETFEETGFKGSVVVRTGEKFKAKHPTKNFDIDMHPYIVQIPKNAKYTKTEDTDGREYDWVIPSQVNERLDKEEMKKAWKQLSNYFGVTVDEGSSS